MPNAKADVAVETPVADVAAETSIDAELAMIEQQHPAIFNVLKFIIDKLPK